MDVLVHVGKNLAVNGASRAAFYWAYKLRQAGVNARLGYCGEWIDEKGYKRSCGLLVDVNFLNKNLPFSVEGLLMPTEYTACTPNGYIPEHARIPFDVIWDFDEQVAPCSKVNPFIHDGREATWVQYVHYPGYLVPSDTKIRLFTTNSSWTLKHVYKIWGNVNAIVAQPAIPIDVIKPCDEPPSRRDYDIVVWDRFDPSKLMGADLVLPRLSTKYRIVIIGSAGRDMEPILRTMGAEEVIINADFETIRKYMCSSRVMMSFKVDEHFGLATAEALAMGVIPLVHMSGGKWEDTCEYGKYCYGFATVIDAFQQAEELVQEARSGNLDRKYYEIRDKGRAHLAMMADTALQNLLAKLATT